MNRITEKITKTAVMLFALCLSGGAWAAVPVPTAVWEAGQFEDAASLHGGYSISRNGNDVVNGKIVISSAATKGVTIDIEDVLGDTSGRDVSVLIKYSGAKAPESQAVFVCNYSYKDSGKFDTGLANTEANSGALKGYWNTTATYPMKTNGAEVYPTVTDNNGSGYLLFSYKHNTGNGIIKGVYGYNGPSVATMTGGANDGLCWPNRYLSKVAIGGPSGEVSSYGVWPDLVIEGIAIFVNKTYTNSDLAAYVFPSDYDYVATISANTSLSDITWTKGSGTPGTDSKVCINTENGAVLTVSGTLDYEVLNVLGDGSITLANGANISSTIISGADINIAASTTVSISDSDILSKITCNGTLNTAGTTILRAENEFTSTSTLNVGGTKTTLNAAKEKLSGNITIAANAELENVRESDSLNFSTSLTVDVYGTLNMGNTRWTLKPSNTINLYAGGEISGNGQGSYGALDAASALTINVKGTSTISAKLRTRSNLTLKVESGTLTYSGATSDEYHDNQLIKTGAGVIESSASPKCIWTVNEGNVIQTAFPDYGVTIADGATFTLKNLAWTEQPDRFSGSGTLELFNDRGFSGNNHQHCTHTVTGVTFPGTLKFTATNTGDYGCGHIISDVGFLSNEVRPQLELDTLTGTYSKLFFSANFDGQTLAVRDLKGTGHLSAKASSGTPQNQTIENMQTKDTEFAGNLLSDNASDTHKTNLKVIGDGTGVAKTLTISRANTSNGELSIADSKVVFTSTGKWSVGTVTVKDGGILESKNSDAIAANLVVEKGATLKFADGIAFSASNCDWTDLAGELTDEEKVKLDLSAVTPSSTPVTLISSGVSSADIFTVSATKYGASVALSVVNGALKATYSGNICENGVWLVGPTANQDASIFLSESSTLTTTSDLTLGTVTVYNISGASAVLSTSGAGELTLGGLNFPYTGITLEVGGSMTVSGSVSGAATISVLDGGELNMDGVTCAPDIIVQSGGTLNASGTTSFSRTLTNAGAFNIESGTTTVAGAFNTQSGSTMSVAVAGQLTISDSEIDPSFAGDVNVSGTMYVIGLYRYAVIDGEINVTGTFSSQGEATVGATGRVIVSGSGVFAVNYGTANSGIIQLPSVSQYQVADGGDKKITNSDSGIVILANSGQINNDSADYSFLKGTGTLVFVNATNNGYWVLPNAESKQFASTLSISNEVVNGICVCYGTNDANNPAITAFRNLSGSGKFRSDWNSSYPNRKLQITQTRNTKWSGQFIAGNRIDGIEVFGVGTTKTLELAGTACTEASRKPPLTIDSTGSVNLSNEWRGNTIVNGEFGGVGSVIGTLNINNGATFKAFASDANGLSVSSTTTFANGDSDNVNIDVSAIVSDIASSGVTLISSTGTLTVDVDKLTVTSGYFCQKEDNLLKVYPIVASVGGTPYATLQAAINAAGANTVTLLQDNSEAITIAAGRTLNIEKGEFACNVPTSSGVITVQTEYNEGTGITTYTAPVAAITSTSSTSYYMSISTTELMTFITLVNADATTTLTIDESVALDQATRTYLATQYDIYFDGTTTYSKAAAKRTFPTVATFNSLASAISDSADGAAITLVQDSNEAITLNKTITLTETATFTGTFTGNGTLIMTELPKAISTSSLWAAGWTGTLWLKGVTFPVIASGDDAGKSIVNPVVFGNANSTLRLTSCSGGFSDDWTYEEEEDKFPGTLDLVDENDTPAFTVTSGWPGYGKTVFAKLTGTGTLTSGNPTKAHYYQFLDASEFRGTITITDNDKFRVGIGTVDATESNGSSIADKTLTIQAGASAAIAAGKTWAAPGGITVDGSLTVPALSSLSGTIAGGGTITCQALHASNYTPTFGTWTGTVVLPYINGTDGGFYFNRYGKAGSTVEIANDFTGWLNTSSEDTRIAKENVVVNAGKTFTISGSNSSTAYGLTKLSGAGNFAFRQTNAPSSFTISTLEDFTGTISNSIGSGTPTAITITKVKLASAPTPGLRLVNTDTPNYVNVSGVYVGEVAQAVNLIKKSDGIYVAATSSVEGSGAAAVTTIATSPSDSEVEVSVNVGDDYTGTIIVPANVTKLATTGTAVADDKLKLKVNYGVDSTAIYENILTRDASGYISLTSDADAAVDGVKVTPEIKTGDAENPPMALSGSAPAFSAKAIPGLWYAVKAASSEADLGDKFKYGTPVQATGDTVNIEAPTFPGTVTYYRLSAGMNQDDVTRYIVSTNRLAVQPTTDGLFAYGENSTTTTAAHDCYRIPAIASTWLPGDAGDPLQAIVMGIYDARTSYWDLGQRMNKTTNERQWNNNEHHFAGIDIAGNYSLDGGASWSAAQIMIDVPNAFDPATGEDNIDSTSGIDKAYDIGDPAIVYVPATEKFLMMGITGGGNSSVSNITANAMGADLAMYECTASSVANGAPNWQKVTGFTKEGVIALLKAKDDTLTFDYPPNGYSFDYDSTRAWTRETVYFLSILQGPGNALVTREDCGSIKAGTIVFPMQYCAKKRKTDGNHVGISYTFALYSTDNGATWNVTSVCKDEAAYGSECCIAQLDDGSLLMEVRPPNASTKRAFFRSTDFNTWTKACELVESAGPAEGSILRIGAKDGKSVYACSFTTGATRADLQLFIGTDYTSDEDVANVAKGINWTTTPFCTIWKGDTGTASTGTGVDTVVYGYSSLVMLDETTLGVLLEAHGQIYFTKIDVSSALK